MKYGVWSAQRALAHARIPGVSGRMEWVVQDSAELLHWLSALGHSDMALEAARSQTDPVARAKALGAAGAPRAVIRMAPVLGRAALTALTDLVWRRIDLPRSGAADRLMCAALATERAATGQSDHTVERIQELFARYSDEWDLDWIDWPPGGSSTEE